MALHTHPIAHTRQIGGGVNCETELARKFRRCLGILTPDEEGTPIDSRDTRYGVSRLQDGGGMLLKPVVKSYSGQFHTFAVPFPSGFNSQPRMSSPVSVIDISLSLAITSCMTGRSSCGPTMPFSDGASAPYQAWWLAVLSSVCDSGTEFQSQRPHHLQDRVETGTAFAG